MQPRSAEKVLMAMWAMEESLEEMIEEVDEDFSLMDDAHGYLYATRSAMAWFESELLFFPEWCLRLAQEFEAEGCSQDAEYWRQVAEEHADQPVVLVE